MRKLLILLIAFLSLLLPAMATEKTSLPSANAIVESIESQTIKSPDSGQDNIRQVVTTKITTGKFKGTNVELENMITGNPAFDIPLKKGSRIILHLETNSDSSQVVSADDVDFYIADLQRSNTIIIFALFFVALLVIIGKKKGLLSLVSIIATVALIFCILVPMILSGFCPIASSVLISIFSTIITIYLVGGFNSKSSSAVIGVCLSLIFAGGLSMTAISLANLTGFAGEENLYLYGNRPDLDFKGILSASMILAALGAVMDVGVSIASSINEVHKTNPQLTVKELFKSGMNVGKDIIGTMSNTLILVYLGSELPLVLLSSNIDLNKFFNLNQVSTEILSAIVGSTSLLACVPITAILAAILIKRNQSSKINFKF